MFYAGCVLVVSLAACSKDDDNNNLNDTDRNFLTMATYSNLAEIDAGTLASTKGQKDSVKMYGAMMVAEHGKAKTSVDSLGKVNNITTPTTLDSLHLLIKQQLMSTAAGRGYDTTYINNQIADHQKTIALFQSEIASGKHQGIRDFATKNLPGIQMHYTMATTLKKNL